MHNALWTLGGDSAIHTLTVRNSRISSEGDRTFRTLTVNKLDATGSDFVLRTDLKNADKINVTEKATGSDNSLNVSFMKDPAQGQSLNIPLVTAPAGTSAEMFKAGTRMIGFGRVTPTCMLTPVVAIRSGYWTVLKRRLIKPLPRRLTVS